MSDSAPAHGVCLTIAYDGTDFAGYQVQPNRRTVQSELERAIATMSEHVGRVRSSGRTDAGVHALGQIVAFDSVRLVAERGWKLGLNQRLPDDIRVQKVWPCAVGYDPRHDSMGKTYRYVVQLGEALNPLLRNRAWQLAKWPELDLVSMRRAARMLEGTHDYRAFRSSQDARPNTVRTIWSIDVLDRYLGDPTLVAFEVRGTAFMKNMVRILAGTLVDVGRGRMALKDVPRALGESAERAHAGETAPAQGLTLVEVALGRQALYAARQSRSE